MKCECTTGLHGEGCGEATQNCIKCGKNLCSNCTQVVIIEPLIFQCFECADKDAPERR